MMESTQMQACEDVCKQQGTNGCCVLHQRETDNTGCWWKSGATSSRLKSANYKSVTCKLGMLQDF